MLFSPQILARAPPRPLVVSPTDPNFSSVKLLMGFDGTNGSFGGAPGFSDESSAAHGVATSNNSSISTAQFVFGVSSVTKSLIGAYMFFGDSTDWSFSTGAFTVECWIRPNAVSGTQWIVGKDSGGTAWSFVLSGTSLVFKIGATTVLTGGTISATTWTAVCVDFDGTKYRLYAGGAMVNSSTSLVTVGTGGTLLLIGSANSGSEFFGYIDELRLTKGVGRYANDSGYTVAAAAFPRS